jgi:5S rRNA maturation endonuclease (ribonuclease M5)
MLRVTCVTTKQEKIKMDESIKVQINKRFTVIDVVKLLVTEDFEEISVNGFTRLKPCPFTDSQKLSFSCGERSYTAFSENWNNSLWDGLPAKGTPADIVRHALPDFSDGQLLEWMMSKTKKMTVKTLKQNVVVEKQHISPEILEAMQEEFLYDMTRARKDWLMRQRGYSRATIEHFQIGFNSVVNMYSYPFFVDGKLVHFKYKKAPNTSQLGNNSGGDYFFNEDALNADVVILVEGEHDVMQLFNRYNAEALGMSGNFFKGSERWKKLEQLKGKTVVLMLDEDDAGKKYESNFKTLLKDNNRVLILPHTGKGKDADEWIRTGGEIDFSSLFQ